MVKTIKDLYDHAHEHNMKLLSDFNGAFWSEYNSNHDTLDRLFMRRFSSFIYAFQDDSDGVPTTVNDFIADVRAFLFANKKRYDELWRVNVIDDEKYSLTDNYDATETMTRTTSGTVGARTDSTNLSTAERNDSHTHSVAPYDSNTTHIESADSDKYGAHTDSETFNQGAQTNNGSESYTMTRKGNIGVMTVSDMLDKHITVWTKYDFYTFVFDEIAKELLLVDGGF